MENRDITVVVQGPYYEGVTEKVLESVRRYFPGAPIVVSTCDNVFKSLKSCCDDLVVSSDPGGFAYADRPGEKENNVNRQIVNTVEGLKRVRTKYALKLRSDFELTGNGFLEFFGKFDKAEEKYKFFSEKVLGCCYFSRNPRSDMPFPFHPSDIAFFGKTEDLIKLFDVPLMTKEEAYWNMEDRHQYQYVPEQYIFIKALRKNGFEVDCGFYNDCNEKNIEETERYFASNFVFLTFDQFEIMHNKNTFSMKVHPNAFKSCYTHVEWMGLYKKYVDDKIVLPRVDDERKKINILYRKYKKYRFLGNLLAMPFKSKATRRAVRNRVLEFFLAK